MRPFVCTLILVAGLLALCLPAQAQDTILQYGFHTIAYESISEYKQLLPGHMGGAMLLSRSVAFPAFTRVGCLVMNKDAQAHSSGIFNDASQAGSPSPFPFPPETYVDMQHAVMPTADEQILLGNYSPTIGAPMIPFLERTVRTSGVTTVTTVKLPPSSMLLTDMCSSPTGYHLLRMHSGGQHYLVRLDTALTPVWVKKMAGFIHSICINAAGDIYLTTASTVSKMRADGVVVWQKSYPGWDEFNSVLANSDGGITLTTRESSSPSFSNTAVMRLDSAGNFLWGRQCPPGRLLGQITHGLGSSSLFVQHDSLSISKLSGMGAVQWTRHYPVASFPSLSPMAMCPGPNGGFWAGYRKPGPTSMPYPYLAYIESAGLILKADSMGNTGCTHINDTILFTAFITSPSTLPVVQPLDTMVAFGNTSDFTLHGSPGGALSGSCYDDCPDPLPPPTVSYPSCTPPYSIAVTLPPGTPPLTTVYVNGVTVPLIGFGTTFSLPLSPDTNHVHIVIQRGGICADTFDFVRIATGIPPKPDLGPDRYLCPGDTVVLNAGSGYATYEWNGPGGSWVLGDSLRSITSLGTKMVRVTNAAGCTHTDTLVVMPPPPVPISGSTSFCTGGGTLLSVDSFCTSVSWSIGGGGGTTVYATAPGIVTATGIDSLGCAFTSSITLSTYTVSVPITGPSAICPSGTAILSLPPSSTGLVWSTGDTTPGILVSLPGTYSATGQDSLGCLFSSSFVLPLSAVASPGLPDTVSLCQGDSYLLTVPASFSDVLWSTSDTSHSLGVFLSGIYTVTCVDAAGCATADTTVVISLPDPVAAFTYLPGTFPTITFSSTSTDADSLHWDFGDLSPGSSLPSPTHTFPSDGSWNVCLTAYNACGSSTACDVILIVGQQSAACDGFEVWPNPTTGTLHLSLPTEWIGGDWMLYGADGRMFSTGLISSAESQLQLTHLTDGVYQLVLRKGDDVKALRVVKME